jgi:hypothetical protein
MTVLSKPQRRQLETTIKQAREIAEEAAREAIARIGVAEAEAPAHLSDDNKALRRRLRAHARALGDARDPMGVMTTARLQDAASYEIWHRMLFGRFLAERSLLIHPELGATVSVAELRDLAKEEGAADEWALAERYAAPGLPGVFKPDDPVLALPIAPEFSKRLRAALSSLPEEVFTADDSLGWTYQFWRASEKEAVDERVTNGAKVGPHEVPAVTQLFTEPYMVKFLLHNTLGAWWAGKVLAKDNRLARDATDEAALRAACALPGIDWEYLRFQRDEEGSGRWQPAAGTFPGWPMRAAEITYCDPCCGSGHFLVEAFGIIAALRQSEEGLSSGDAAIAVLQDNLHGLELDGRCVQIAAFNVALEAWKLAGATISLPSPRVAWVGAPPPMSRTEMASLANGDTSLRHALEQLYDQFTTAPLLGSLLEVGARDLLDADIRKRGEAALSKLSESEPESAEGAVAARGLLEAAALLSKKYVFLATNVPFLGRGKQNPELIRFVENSMPEAKADLASAMLHRMIRMLRPGGAIAAVTPQTWLYLKGYEDFRKNIILSRQFRMIVDLGPAAFQDMNWWAARTALVTFTNSQSSTSNYIAINADTGRDFEAKPDFLKDGHFSIRRQSDQLRNPDARILTSVVTEGVPLVRLASSLQGIKTGDDGALRRHFWEVDPTSSHWKKLQTTVEKTQAYGGLTDVVWWFEPEKSIARLQGTRAYGQIGCAVNQMGSLPCAIYVGEAFDSNISVIIPMNKEDLPAIFAYICSPEFRRDVRALEPGTKANNAILVQVPFNVSDWAEKAKIQFPNGLPEPYSDDPTQWLFHGHPRFAESGTELHVALARLSGYRWPAETDARMRLSEIARQRITQAAALPIGDADGLLPLHAAGSKPSLADRLRAMLEAAYGTAPSPAQEQALVRAADARCDKKEARDATLEAWLRDRAFRQHGFLFHQRPFLWQVWDGMPDGFSAFLHYHRLDNAALNTLTYTILGDWIRTAKAAGNTARQERAEQLQQKLPKIIEGENPYDIFVRWKPLAKQPLGWNPDLDDGVRLNIRPFMTAGILREQPKGIAWTKDRGTDVPSAPWYSLGPSYGGKPGDRINDHNTTLAEKRAARGSS